MNRSILFFDTECVFCNRTMLAIFRLDKDGTFHFASLNNHALMKSLGMNVPYDNTSIVYYRRGEIHVKSKAIRMIANDLGGIFRVFGFLLKFIPSAFVNAGYTFVATNRYRISRNMECELPSELMKARILNRGDF